MSEVAQVELKPAAEIARIAPIQQAPNGIHYATYGDTQLSASELEQIIRAIPRAIAAALEAKAYYFVPLTFAELPPSEPSGEDIVLSADTLFIAAEYSTELADNAICHRNATIAGIECVFISTRLMQDRFALAFELYINAGHHLVEAAGVPESFMHLVWSQAEAGIRGETSQDAWEHRGRALGRTGEQPRPQPRPRRTRSLSIEPPQKPASSEFRSQEGKAIDEKARTQYFDAAFADAIAIYLLSLTVDFDYTELREREYPLLAAPALAERLRHVAQLFPPNPGQEFSIHYRRR
ncbi:MAG: hypothetical protein ABI164_04780 [Acidobacteriaceae bacterium]